MSECRDKETERERERERAKPSLTARGTHTHAHINVPVAQLAQPAQEPVSQSICRLVLTLVACIGLALTGLAAGCQLLSGPIALVRSDRRA
jgi:hypothetical protein